MSARNGDKARFQKNRKRRLYARAQIRALVAGAGTKTPGEPVTVSPNEVTPAPEVRRAKARH